MRTLSLSFLTFVEFHFGAGEALEAGKYNDIWYNVWMK